MAIRSKSNHTLFITPASITNNLSVFTFNVYMDFAGSFMQVHSHNVSESQLTPLYTLLSSGEESGIEPT